MRKIFIILFLLALTAGGFIWWQRAGHDREIQVIAAETVKRGTVRKVFEETGIVKSQVGAIVKIGTRATGTIERMLVKVGDPVEKGQLVARIDSRELRAQQAEARARLESARAELARIRRVYPLRIEEAESELDLARSQAEYLENNYRRLRKVHEEKLVSRDELENARQKAQVEANRVEAKSAVLERERGEFQEELRKAELAVQSAKAALEAIEIRISYTRIESPITGIVSNVTAQEGETIVAGLQVANLITVLDPSRLEMWVYVDETDVGQVRAGQKVEFTVDAYPDRVFRGGIAAIYPEPEIRDNIVYYRALVAVDPTRSEFLRPEMTTQVRIVVEEKENVLMVPNSALKWVEGRQVIFVQEEDGSVRQVTPELGLSGLAASEVVEGLREGEKVATEVVLPRNPPQR